LPLIEELSRRPIKQSARSSHTFVASFQHSGRGVLLVGGVHPEIALNSSHARAPSGKGCPPRQRQRALRRDSGIHGVNLRAIVQSRWRRSAPLLVAAAAHSGGNVALTVKPGSLMLPALLSLDRKATSPSS
jgi:hypothetical protein